MGRICYRSHMKLVVRGPLDAEACRRVVPGIAVVGAATAEELVAKSADADIVIGAVPDGFAELLRRARRLRWAHTSIAGVDRFLCPEFLESPVVLTCAKGGPAGPNLAEHAFALLLALTRHVAHAARARTWLRRGLSEGVHELGGRTMGLAGYGGVGREVARRARAFDMSVIAIKRGPVEGTSGNGDTVWEPDRFHEMLALADAVVVSLPGTEKTRHLFDQAAFAAMRSGSVLVNVGRGTTVDLDALVAALESGRIAGAGLDVTDPEPLPDDHPLWRMDNVVITPHIAGAAPERAVRNGRLVLENLRRFAAGEPLLGAVDGMAGY